MSITNRLSLFFLGGLGLVLGGFSLALYGLASQYLHAQADQRLDAAMQTLTAAIEVHAADVEWEPLERRVTLGEDPGPDQIRWAIHDLQGKLIDRSQNLDSPLNQHTPHPSPVWRCRVSKLKAGIFEPEPIDTGHAPGWEARYPDLPNRQPPGSVALPRDRTHLSDGYLITAMLDDGPIHAALNWLALAMAGISAAILCIAALWGRWLCRGALAPILQMAASARTIRQQPDSRALLEVAPTNDELQDLGQAFNDLLLDLREAAERQRQFAGDASHQLRTPLTAMLGQVEVALRHDRDPEEYRRVLKILRRRGEQLHQIIATLLLLARAQPGAPQPELEKVDLAAWLCSWIGHWTDHPRFGDFDLQIGPSPLTVQTHPAFIAQILDNLLDNACKYSEAGTPIHLGLEVENDRAVLSVTDQGRGIPVAEQALIYQPFYRAEQARWHGDVGVGLGLTVVQRLTAMVGGEVTLVSEVGQGSAFRVSLPLDSHFRAADSLPSLPAIQVQPVARASA